MFDGDVNFDDLMCRKFLQGFYYNIAVNSKRLQYL